jgi:hypothetical protein
VKQQIQAAGTEALLVQQGAELNHQQTDVVAKVWAALIGSTKACLTSIRSAALIGEIGSKMRPNAWSRRRPGSGPKRRARGARGWLASSPFRSKPTRLAVPRQQPARYVVPDW